MVTLKNIEKSFRSQKQAIKEMFDLFPHAHFEQNTSSYNSRDFKEFRTFGVSFKEFAKIATRQYIRTDDLFDFGRPKIIEKTFWTYGSSFFQVSLYCEIPYTVYCGQDKIIQMIRLEWGGNPFGVGLKGWKNRYKEILSALDINEKLNVEYRENVEIANDCVERWQKAIKNVAKITV